MDRHFEPRLQRLDLIPPRRVGSPDGPTRGSAYGPGWLRTGHGLFVPAARPASPEQRVIESAMPMPQGSALTGWAGLRLAGAAFFDGRSRPVTIVVGERGNPRPRLGVRWLRREVAGPVTLAAGLPLVGPATALLDHIDDELRRGRPRDAVVSIDMTLATASASPPETSLRLIWTIDCDLPEPVLNTWVLDESAGQVAVPDLLEPVSGTVVEYDGAPHAGARRRSRDAEKDDVYRELGLEPVRVTAPESTSVGG